MAFKRFGLSNATEFVITGGSAGGLSTFLHADRAAARLQKEAPGCSTIRAAPIVGYFLDHDNYKHTDGYPGGPNTPQWSTPGTGANYTMWMKYVFSMQNMSFGADGGLTEACKQKHQHGKPSGSTRACTEGKDIGDQTEGEGKISRPIPIAMACQSEA